MKPHPIAAPILAAAVLVASASHHPVVYEEPDFERRTVKKERAAFLLADDIDARDEVQGLVNAFDGDPDRGVAFLLHRLSLLMTGEESVGPVRRRSRSQPMKLVDLRSQAGSLPPLMSLEPDRWGILSLEVHDPAALAELLALLDVAYLVVIDDLVLSRIVTTEPLGKMGVTHLAGQVLVWHRDSRSLKLHTYLNGTDSIGFPRGFTENTAQEVARSFASNLHMVFD